MLLSLLEPGYGAENFPYIQGAGYCGHFAANPEQDVGFEKLANWKSGKVLFLSQYSSMINVLVRSKILAKVERMEIGL